MEQEQASFLLDPVYPETSATRQAEQKCMAASAHVLNIWDCAKFLGMTGGHGAAWNVHVHGPLYA